MERDQQCVCVHELLHMGGYKLTCDVLKILDLMFNISVWFLLSHAAGRLYEGYVCTVQPYSVKYQRFHGLRNSTLLPFDIKFPVVFMSRQPLLTIGGLPKG